MEKTVKVLYFVDRMLRGGIQSLVIDWISRFDAKKIHIDFLLLDDGNQYELEDTLKRLGCGVYKLEDVWLKTPMDFIKYKKALNSFFLKHHDYKVVHLHSSSKNYMVLKYAKKYGIPIRISHSHNIDFQTKNLIKKIVGNCFKYPLIKYSTNYLACSNLAGRWLFGEKKLTDAKYEVINNAVDYDRFKYDRGIRKKIREELGIKEDNIIIGHVGRFTNQKNHTFLVEIFNEFYKKDKNARLLLIGIGELEEEIKKKVEELGLSKKVIFAGFKSNVNEYMQAMDIFLLPSLYEGLPVVGVEAQAAGLPCYMSKDVITDEVKIADNVTFIPLSNSAEEWANIIYNSNNSRSDNYIKIKERGYIIEDVIKKLERIYQGKE